jgi:hypothetical protein
LNFKNIQKDYSRLHFNFSKFITEYPKKFNFCEYFNPYWNINNNIIKDIEIQLICTSNYEIVNTTKIDKKTSSFAIWTDHNFFIIYLDKDNIVCKVQIDVVKEKYCLKITENPSIKNLIHFDYRKNFKLEN